jgi:hypothetical protein
MLGLVAVNCIHVALVLVLIFIFRCFVSNPTLHWFVFAIFWDVINLWTMAQCVFFCESLRRVCFATELYAFLLCAVGIRWPSVGIITYCSVKYYPINVTQIYVSTVYFILKQGYMFRLEVSHLQAPTTFFVTRCFAHFGIPQCLQLWNTS